MELYVLFVHISLADKLAARTVPGTLYRTLDKERNYIQCYSCAHYCKIKDGKSGICNVRFNDEGILKVPFNYIGAFQCDPIEKKPFFHAYPKTLALSFGMLGCDFKCGYCQNWQISQSIRDPNAGRDPRDITPKEFVQTAINLNARSVVSTYNEPLITSEWAVEIFKEAKKRDLATGYVSNGNATSEVLDYIQPHIDMYKIDLKAFNKRAYQSLGGNLEKILKAVKMVHDRGIWLEIVTLLIPGFNDDPKELQQMAEFIVDISQDIPWHITAFHKDYKMQDPDNTNVNDLLKAAEIGRRAGLNFIYPGNLPGRVGDWENTYCGECNALLVKRLGFEVLDYELNSEGRCPKCDLSVPGIWESPKKRERLFYFLT